MMSWALQTILFYTSQCIRYGIASFGIFRKVISQKPIRITALFETLFSFFLYKTGSLLLKKPGHNAPLIKYLCQNRKSHSLKVSVEVMSCYCWKNRCYEDRNKVHDPSNLGKLNQAKWSRFLSWKSYWYLLYMHGNYNM